MYLGPHHFQAQSRYFEDSIQFATASLWFAPFGLAGIKMDGEALRNGTVSIVHARGILPDGLPFDMPESDAPPPARTIGDLFPPIRDSILVLLAIPPRKRNGYNCSLTEDGAVARYQAESQLLSDENSGADERSVRMGRKNVRILFDTEPTDEFLTQPIARVVRDGSGHYVYDSRFVPPLLDISGSTTLMMMVQRIIEILDEKAATISRGSGRGSQIGTEFSTREIANFWLLHAINSALPPLRHQMVAKHGHPEELFIEMSRLAGALCTFALESHPRTLPLYDHLRLGDVFDELERHIRLHLETIVPTNCISIPLKPAGDYYWEGDIIDQRCLGRSRWVFAIHADMGEALLMESTPRLIKVCTPQFVRRLVADALPGMALTHLPIPPSAISTRVETHYFGISRTGGCWDHMTKVRKVGVYIPGEFPNPDAEILVVLDNQT